MGDSPTPSDHTLQVQRLFVQHQQVVLYYVLTIEPNLGDAQDNVQEAFLTVSRKAETYALGTNFPAWACTVARYQANSHPRRPTSSAAAPTSGRCRKTSPPPSAGRPTPCASPSRAPARPSAPASIARSALPNFHEA